MADKLGRSRTIINVPSKEYSRIVTKYNTYEQLQDHNVRIELEKREAIGAKNLAENKIKELEAELEQYKGFPRWFVRLKNFFKSVFRYELQGNA